jgi:hypothetical protein
MARAYIRECSSPTSADGEINLELLSGIPPFSFDWSNGKSSQYITDLLPGFYSVLITDDLNCTDSLFYRLGVATGIYSESEMKERNIRLYPNPSTGELYLDGLIPQTHYEVRIFDLSGRVMFQQAVIGSQSTDKMTLTSLENGLYILNLSSSEEFHSLKLIIKK